MTTGLVVGRAMAISRMSESRTCGVMLSFTGLPWSVTTHTMLALGGCWFKCSTGCCGGLRALKLYAHDQGSTMSVIEQMASGGTLTQQAKPTATVPTAGDYVAEFKFDGWRLVAHVREDKVAFYSRSGKRYDGRLPQVAAELQKRFPAGTWLDGEAVAITFDEDGKVRNDWHVAQSALTKQNPAMAAKITYVVFDMIAHRDIDARPLPFSKRRELLEKAMDQVEAPVQLSLTMDATQSNVDRMMTLGFEGAVLKNLSAPYASGKRGSGWLKIKAQGSEDVVIMGFEKGKDVGTIVFGQFKDGKLLERGRCKRKVIVPADESEVGKVIEVQYSQIMPSGALRHPRLLRRREDKPAEACVWA